MKLTLDLLRALVAFDTQNPPRALSPKHPLFSWLHTMLPDFQLQLEDLGEGCLSLLATRGEPKLLFNCHLDTVPVNPGWSRNPFELLVSGEHAVGLGACDIKGAAACLLRVAQSSQAPMAILFNTDEEAGQSRSIRHFLEREHPWREVLVCEPSGCRAVLEHRGIVTFRGRFSGRSGHGSLPRALKESAIHAALRWGARALTLAEAAEETEYRGLRGLALNIGRIEGGQKPNMIAEHLELRWGMRPLPNQDAAALKAELCKDSPHVTWTQGFSGPSLPAPRKGKPGSSRVPAVEALAQRLGLLLHPPVPFWTEAALFSEAGFEALVCGPGDIEQAHSADEWLSLAQLQAGLNTYRAILERSL